MKKIDKISIISLHLLRQPTVKSMQLILYDYFI